MEARGTEHPFLGAQDCPVGAPRELPSGWSPPALPTHASPLLPPLRPSQAPSICTAHTILLLPHPLPSSAPRGRSRRLAESLPHPALLLSWPIRHRGQDIPSTPFTDLHLCAELGSELHFHGDKGMNVLANPG